MYDSIALELSPFNKGNAPRTLPVDLKKLMPGLGEGNVFLWFVSFTVTACGRI